LGHLKIFSETNRPEKLNVHESFLTESRYNFIQIGDCFLYMYCVLIIDLSLEQVLGPHATANTIAQAIQRGQSLSTKEKLGSILKPCL
jgi:hypothetical protein